MTAQEPTTRDRIADAAASLFLLRGLAGTGLKDISVAAEAPIGSVYHHFPGGKTELAAEALRRSGAMYGMLVGAVLASEPDPVERMRVAFDGASETVATTDFADACPVATVALEVASSDDELRQVCADVFTSWLDALVPTMAELGADRETTRSISLLFLAALEGGFLLSRVQRDATILSSIGEAMATLCAAVAAGG